MAILWNPIYYRWHPRKKTIKHQENVVPEICSVHSSNEIKGAQPFFTPVSLAVKMNTLGLERRLSGKEHLLLFWRLKFSSQHPHQLTLPVTLDPGSHASGFHGHLHSRAHTQTYTHTIKLIKVNLKMNVLFTHIKTNTHFRSAFLYWGSAVVWEPVSSRDTGVPKWHAGHCPSWQCLWNRMHRPNPETLRTIQWLWNGFLFTGFLKKLPLFSVLHFMICYVYVWII